MQAILEAVFQVLGYIGLHVKFTKRKFSHQVENIKLYINYIKLEIMELKRKNYDSDEKLAQ